MDGSARDRDLRGRADRRLHLTQPTLCRQLRERERRLSVDLFARSGRDRVRDTAGNVGQRDSSLVRRSRKARRAGSALSVAAWA
ncbi:LysR family transcriptional regulator [Microtetraspora malaysiensis]|uniref:LysR family transcriptional regulator n=1 Tax=Microtetraspora malaysiensis TaxID=161358 RepID=UPI003D91CAF2